MRNAMVVHAAFGGSTNLLLHIPAIAHRGRPAAADGGGLDDVNRSVPRLVDVLPNGPVEASDGAGVPGRRRAGSDAAPARAGLLELDALTVTGADARRGARLVGEVRAPRTCCASAAAKRDGVDPDDVIMSPDTARERGLTSTVCFPARQPRARKASVIKSTAIDPSVVDADGVYRKTGPARVFTSERDAIAAIKSNGRPHQAGRRDRADRPRPDGRRHGGDLSDHVGAEASAVRQARGGHHRRAVLRRLARAPASATSGPEALAGGPIGKLRDGDMIQIVIDRNKLEGTVNLVGPTAQWRRVRRCSKRARCVPICAQMRVCQTIRAYGRRYRMCRAAHGVGRCTTWTRSYA